MPDFSERYGYKTSKILQVESIDDALKNRIWSYIYEYSEFEHGQNHIIYKYIWVNFFKLCIDEIPVCRNGEVYLIEFLKIAKYIYISMNLNGMKYLILLSLCNEYIHRKIRVKQNLLAKQSTGFLKRKNPVTG